MSGHAALTRFVEARELLYLSTVDVRDLGVFDFAWAVDRIEQAYRAHYAGDTVMPKTEYLKYSGRSSYDRLIVLPGYLGGPFGASAVKLIGSSRTNGSLGFPRASGLLVLFDPESQRPFCIMEGAQVSAVRTAAVTALAIRLLAPTVITKLAMVGCGFLAEVHLRMWSSLYRHRIARVHAYDVSNEAILRLCAAAESLQLELIRADSAEEAIREADVIIPATTSDTPYIRASWIRPGSSYFAVSLLDPELDVFLQADCIVVDDLDLCQQEGRPLDLLKRQGRSALRVVSIGSVVLERIQVRRQPEDRIVFNPMGTVITDLSLGLPLFEKAAATGKGVRLPC